MQNDITLFRIDATRNMSRFYSISLQPTLFGEQSVVRAWGRIGTRGRQLSVICTSIEAARLAFSKAELMKRRRGYIDTPTDVPTIGAGSSFRVVPRQMDRQLSLLF